jgi:uncharacterized membrane protein
MVMMSRSVEIDAPVEKVFSFLTKPENLLEIWPSMVEISNAQSAPDGSHSFDWVYKMGGLRFHGRAESTAAEKNKRVVSKNEKGIPSTFEYLYEAIGNKTRLTLNVDYSLPSQLLTKLAEPVLRRINENEAETLLSNLKIRMEHGRATAVEQPTAH